MALRIMQQSFQVALAISISWFAGTMIPAFGQQAEHTQNTDKSSEAEFAPRGERMPRNITYSDWQKLCFKDSHGKVVCRTTTSGTLDTGQLAVRLAVIERKGDSAKRLQIFVPVGLYLQAGVKVKVDNGPSIRIPYNWCLTNICVAGNLLEPQLLREMEGGRKLTLEVVDSNLVSVPTGISLDRFAEVHKGEPAKTLEFPPPEE